jgi:hypothetical protein
MVSMKGSHANRETVHLGCISSFIWMKRRSASLLCQTSDWHHLGSCWHLRITQCTKRISLNIVCLSMFKHQSEPYICLRDGQYAKGCCCPDLQHSGLQLPSSIHGELFNRARRCQPVNTFEHRVTFKRRFVEFVTLVFRLFILFIYFFFDVFLFFFYLFIYLLLLFFFQRIHKKHII